MTTINVEQRLRPTRFAFLVRPDDATGAHKIFRVNTCLWGGKYNPVIPFFRRVPSWWERKGLRFENATQILNGYLDFFEPDVLVESQKGLAKDLGFDDQRSVHVDDILHRSGDRDRNSYGLGVLDLYRHLFKREFQFVRRNKHNLISVVAEEKSFDGFAACVFGTFPSNPLLRYFGKAYEEAFDPRKIVLNATTLEELYRSGFTSALTVGHSQIEVEYKDYHDPILFVLDAAESKDLVDFWNLRAVHRNVLPIPVQWLDQLSAFCREIIKKNHRPLPGNNRGVMIRQTVMFSRSISEKDIDTLYPKYLMIPDKGANVRQDWYPPVWRPTSEIVVRSLRPTLEAGEKSTDVAVDLDDPQVRFEPLHPEFAERFGGNLRWANVISLGGWSLRDRLATTFPTNYKKPNFPKCRVGREQVLSTSEGLVSLHEHKNLGELWTLTDGATAIRDWLKVHKVQARLSDAGRSTQQIIQTLDGFRGVHSIAHPGIIGLLDEMSRRPISRSAHFAEFQNKINAAVKEDIWRGREFETLVDKKAVELGQQLKCSRCGSWGWYALKQLDTTITCELCLKPFSFPLKDPGNSQKARWAYRVLGPFALPNYANGGYASALAIRFFAEVIGDRPAITWSAGQELTFEDKTSMEADFILWFRRSASFGFNPPTETVFGEAKTKGRDTFKDEDVARLKALAIRFPGSVLVCATLKEGKELSKEEVSRLAKLADWGRDYDRERRKSRAPLVVLTATELFAPWHLEPAWKDLGGKHKALVDPAWVRVDNLRVLADMTQQLYLGMVPYHEWREAKWKKRMAARKKAAA